MPIERYNAAEAEPRWQKVWDERGIFATPNHPTCESALGGERAFQSPQGGRYLLDMFLSGRIHMANFECQGHE